MEVLIVLVPFVVGGLGVIFIAFWGGPSAAREAYLTRGGRFFTLAMVLLYLALGVAVPVAVIGARGEAEGATGSLRSKQISGKLEDGTGPNLDELAPLDKQRVLQAIERGGTGTGRMPPNLLEGEDADAVATYVSQVAGR